MRGPLLCYVCVENIFTLLVRILVPVFLPSFEIFLAFEFCCVILELALDCFIVALAVILEFFFFFFFFFFFSAPEFWTVVLAFEFGFFFLIFLWFFLIDVSFILRVPP